jgi:hypothetical protein
VDDSVILDCHRLGGHELLLALGEGLDALGQVSLQLRDLDEKVLGIVCLTTDAFEQGIGEGAMLESIEFQGARPS